MSVAAKRSYEIVVTCLKRDLPQLSLSVGNLRRFLKVAEIFVITRKSEFPVFESTLGTSVTLLDEDALIPTMSLQALRKLNLARFPAGAGWYFQQLLKLGFAFQKSLNEHYLIWDADTVLLRPTEFLDSENRMIFTKASEYHEPYFQNYRKLIGHEPHREFSFISQHVIVNKAILREMLMSIEQRFAGEENWAWKIMRNLEGTSPNLFSEYEFYGHYVKNMYPDRAVFRELPWTRDGTILTRSNPTRADLDELSREFAFAAFEASQQPLRRIVRTIKRYFRRLSSSS